MRGLDVRKEEAPRFAGEVVGHVQTECARQITGDPGLDEARDHPCGLRIVEQHDIVGPHPLSQELGLGEAVTLVDRSLVLAELAAVVGPVKAM